MRNLAGFFFYCLIMGQAKKESNFMPGNIIYFGDIKMGLVTLPRNLKGNTSFFRFSGTEIPEGGYITETKSTETH